MTPSTNDVIQPINRHQRPDIIRPIPRRLSQIKCKSAIIHPRMVRGFHQECEVAGLNQEAIHAAVEQSEEWHRKWTLQEEEGHTMPHHVSWRTDGTNNNNLPLSGSSWDSLEEETWACESPVFRPLEAPPLLSPLLLPATSFPEEEKPPHIPPFLFFPLPEQSSVHSELNSASSACGMELYKEALYHALSISGGDTSTQEFGKAILPLIQTYHELGWDARYPKNNERKLEGMWLTLSKATFFGSLGENGSGDPMYTLGRMAFDMFLPTQLVCSLQGNFNPVHIVPPDSRPETIPQKLLEEVVMGNHVLRTYNIVTAFTIEPHMAAYPDAPNKNVRRPIKGIMITYGYVLPDPQVPNRLTIWFTGGRLKPNDDEYDTQEWKRVFGAPQPQRTLAEKARVLAASLLMGARVPVTMEDDGTMEYSFTRPLGGHGVAYVDVIYLDNSLRIVRGHRGTLFVFTRIPDDGSFQ